jgi:hypothetical protein
MSKCDVLNSDKVHFLIQMCMQMMHSSSHNCNHCMINIQMVICKLHWEFFDDFNAICFSWP